MASDSALALAGLSMGGLGALLLGVRSAPRFRALAGLSSITEFRDLRLFVGDLSSYGVDPSEHSVAEAVLTHDGPLPAIYLCCGSDDVLIEQNRVLHERLRAAGIDHQWVESPGGHEWAYWRDELPGALRFLGRALANP